MTSKWPCTSYKTFKVTCRSNCFNSMIIKQTCALFPKQNNENSSVRMAGRKLQRSGNIGSLHRGSIIAVFVSHLMLVSHLRFVHRWRSPRVTLSAVHFFHLHTKNCSCFPFTNALYTLRRTIYEAAFPWPSCMQNRFLSTKTNGAFPVDSMVLQRERRLILFVKKEFLFCIKISTISTLYVVVTWVLIVLNLRSRELLARTSSITILLELNK